MIKILQGLKRLLYGSTTIFSTRKGSSTLKGSSWVEIYREMTKTPVKLISIEFVTENNVVAEYRIVIDGVKAFPFGDRSAIQSGVTGNFLIPIEVSAGSLLQVEIRGQVKSENVIILNEMAVVEIR